MKYLKGVKKIAMGPSGKITALSEDNLVWICDGCSVDITQWNGGIDFQLVPDIAAIIDIATGYYHHMALRVDGTVWTWGLNGSGQLGDGTVTNRETPVQVAGIDQVIAIAAGHWHSLALKQDGSVWAWGSNVRGQLGDGTTTNRTIPVKCLIDKRRIVQIYGNDESSVVVDAVGLMLCVGGWQRG